ncbi:MAG: hypothetical protein ACXVFN_06055 [Solirubrobacteraceae bacterium]
MPRHSPHARQAQRIAARRSLPTAATFPLVSDADPKPLLRDEGDFRDPFALAVGPP